MSKRAVICLLIVLAISGCSKSAKSISPTVTLTASAASGTSTVQGSPMPATFPTLPDVTPTSSASPTPFTPFTVKPTVDTVKVRVNPGLLFEALILVNQTDELTVMGMAPGGEWIYIKTADGTEGWVFAQLLQSSVDLTRIPVREPKNVVLIRGRVVDVAGLPIQGIGFDISQASGSESSVNRALTDETGIFYSYLPETASGTWTVNYTSVACKSNIWTDSTCSTYKPGYTGVVDPLSQSVILPQGNNSLAFTFR